MGDPHRLEAIHPASLHPRAGGLVKSNQDVELLAHRPERVVVRVVPRPVVVDVGAQKRGLHPHRGGAAHLGDRAVDVMRRDRRGAEHALRVARLDVVVQPIVVGAARRGREARVHAGKSGDIHRRGREQDRQIETFLIHCPDLRLRVKIAGDLLGVAGGQRLLLGVADGRPVTARHSRHDLALDHGADVPFALAEPAWRASSEFGIDVALPEIDRLHHMHLGIDHLEAVFRHD